MKMTHNEVAYIEAQLVLDSGHTLAEDNPLWLANRLARFFELNPNSQFS